MTGREELEPRTDGAPGTGRLTRRTLAVGAAWSAPVILVGKPAAAVAASPVCPPGCPTAGFGGGVNLNGWQLSTTGSFDSGANQQIGFTSSYTPQTTAGQCSGIVGGLGGGTITNAIIGQGDPTGAGATITYAKTLCLRVGVTYTFTFSWNTLSVNPRAQAMQATLTPPAGAAVNVGAVVNAPSLSPNSRGTRSASYTATATGNHVFRYFWQFGTSPTRYTNACSARQPGDPGSATLINARYANDIAVTAPTITCNPTP